MKIIHQASELEQFSKPLALAIGVFDGLHLGHQSVIAAAQEKAKAEGGSCVVMTFSPHPAKVLRPDLAPSLLFTPAQQARQLRKLGVDGLLLQRFDTAFASLSSEEFVKVLKDCCPNLKWICVGSNWTFGRDREGSILRLQELGQKYGFEAIGVNELTCEQGVMSSSRIRAALKNGDLSTTSKLLGRPFSFFGKVVHGLAMARTLGFPTANLAVDVEISPPYGVYAVRVSNAEETWTKFGVANWGIKPTIDAQMVLPMLEVHIFDFNGDLYCQDLEVELLSFIRPEMKYESIDALRHQIGLDVLQAKSVTYQLSA